MNGIEMKFLIVLVTLFLCACTTQQFTKSNTQIIYEAKLKLQQQTDELERQKLKDISNDILTKKAWFNPYLCSDIKILKGRSYLHSTNEGEGLFSSQDEYFELRFVDVNISFLRNYITRVRIDVMTSQGENGFFTKNITNNTIKIVDPPGKGSDCFFLSNPRAYLEDFKKCDKLCSTLKKQESFEYNQKIKNYTIINQPNTIRKTKVSVKALPKKVTLKPKAQSSNQFQYYGDSCPCSSSANCVGPRGGTYCITSGGNKRYR